MSTAAVSVGTSATALVAENLTTPRRIGLIIDNQGTQTVELGDSSGLTFGAGITLRAGDKMIFDFDGGVNQPFFFNGGMWGIVTSGTADVRVMELVETR